MSDILCSFSGRYGDILWSLATVKELSKIYGKKIDFFTMPAYASLAPLLKAQSYIDNTGVIENWVCSGSPYGDQPWQPPQEFEQQYAKSFHLTYRGHPGITAPAMSLIDFIAWQQNIKISQPIPFIDVGGHVWSEKKWVAMGFNEMYVKEKGEFKKAVQERVPGINFIDVGTYDWKEAAWLIKNSLLYLGDRSACWVIANGVGKEIITFEPHPSRNAHGHMGKIFGNPYGQEVAIPATTPVTQAADMAANVIRTKLEKEPCLQ